MVSGYHNFQWSLDILTKSTIWTNIFGEGQFDEYKFAEKTISRDTLTKSKILQIFAAKNTI